MTSLHVALVSMTVDAGFSRDLFAASFAAVRVLIAKPITGIKIFAPNLLAWKMVGTRASAIPGLVASYYFANMKLAELGIFDGIVMAILDSTFVFQMRLAEACISVFDLATHWNLAAMRRAVPRRLSFHGVCYNLTAWASAFPVMFAELHIWVVFLRKRTEYVV